MSLLYKPQRSSGSLVQEVNLVQDIGNSTSFCIFFDLRDLSEIWDPLVQDVECRKQACECVYEPLMVISITSPD